MNNFLICSGYHERHDGDRQFASAIWMRNLLRYVQPAPKVVIITTGKIFPSYGPNVQEIRGGNLGHLGDHMSGEARGQLCGWSASVIALCLIAYNCNRDLIYLEQDALAFGDWITQAYADMGDAGMVFGQKHQNEPWMPCSQSLFIIKHKFLLPFVARYLALPPDAEMNPENKFVELERISPGGFARLSFGVDRCRPIPWNAPVFYAQRWTEDELSEARKRGLS